MQSLRKWKKLKPLELKILLAAHCSSLVVVVGQNLCLGCISVTAAGEERITFYGLKGVSQAIVTSSDLVQGRDIWLTVRQVLGTCCAANDGG